MDSPKKRGKTSGVLGTLAGKIANTSNLMRRNTGHVNSRVAERWRKSPHVPTTTVDEDFEALILELDTVTYACEELIVSHTNFTKTYLTMIQNSHHAATFVHQLAKSNKSSGESRVHNDRSRYMDLCEGSKSYAATLSEVHICVKETLEALSGQLDERIRRVLEYSEKIRERVSLRDRALMSFDRVYDKVDNLTILSTTNGFSAKQRSDWKALERKLVELGKAYDEHNALLKSELPCFFILLRAFMEPLTQFVFFVHLTATYETQRNVSAICQLLNKSGAFVKVPFSSFNGVTVRNRVKTPQAVQPWAELPQKKDGRIKPPADIADNSNEPPKKECILFRAIHNFSSVAETDLEFAKGDVIQVASFEGDWWLGSFAGREGIFPSSFVEKVT